MPAALRGAGKFCKFTLVHKLNLSPFVRLFRFKIPPEFSSLGLPLGQHVHFKAEIKGETVVRPYSPLSFTDETFDVILKVLSKEHQGVGKMSQYLDTLSPGDLLEVSGPAGKLVFKDPRTIAIEGRETTVESLGFVAVETGIAPCFQIISHLANTRAIADIGLVYINRSNEEILLNQELQSLKKNEIIRLSLVDYDKPGDMPPLLPAPSASTVIVQCGPRKVIAQSRRQLEAFGHSAIIDL